MRALLALLAAAAAALPSAPALADGPGAGLTAGHDSRDFRRDREDRRDRRREGFDSSVFVYDRDWQGDSAWRANSFNDWWHERPHRSSPRWVSRNRDCTQLWWSGGTWRC